MPYILLQTQSHNGGLNLCNLMGPDSAAVCLFETYSDGLVTKAVHLGVTPLLPLFQLQYLLVHSQSETAQSALQVPSNHCLLTFPLFFPLSSAFVALQLLHASFQHFVFLFRTGVLDSVVVLRLIQRVFSFWGPLRGAGLAGFKFLLHPLLVELGLLHERVEEGGWVEVPPLARCPPISLHH